MKTKQPEHTFYLMRICAGKDRNMATAKKTGKRRPGPKPGAVRNKKEEIADAVKAHLRAADEKYNEMEAAVDLFLPAHLKRYLNASSLTPAQAYFIGAASAHFVASMSGLQKEFLMSALNAQTGRPGIVPPECIPDIEDFAE
jgi:hypothetical protein